MGGSGHLDDGRKSTSKWSASKKRASKKRYRSPSPEMLTQLRRSKRLKEASNHRNFADDHELPSLSQLSLSEPSLNADADSNCSGSVADVEGGPRSASSCPTTGLDEAVHTIL